MKLNRILLRFTIFLLVVSYVLPEKCKRRIRIGEPFGLVIPKQAPFYSLKTNQIEESGFRILHIKDEKESVELHLVSFRIDSIQCLEIVFQDSFLMPVFSDKVCYCFQTSLTESDSLQFIPFSRVENKLESAEERSYLFLFIILFSLLVLLGVLFQKKLFLMYKKWKLKKRYKKLIDYVISIPSTLPFPLYIEKLNRVWKEAMKEDFHIPIGAMTYEEIKLNLSHSILFHNKIIQLLLSLIKAELDACFYHRLFKHEEVDGLREQVVLLLKLMCESQVQQIKEKDGL